MSARVAFVTGASRGIGRAAAVALAEHGHRVAFCYSADEEGAKETQTAVEARTFNAESADEAAAVLIDTLEAVRDRAVPQLVGALAAPGAVIDELREILAP